MFDVPVRKMMRRRKLVTVAPDVSVADVAKLMSRRNVGAVIVVENDALAGIFTERDVVCRVVAKRKDPEATLVGEVMTSAPQTIGPNEPLGVALAIMYRHGFRHLPVLDGNQLIGVLSGRSAMDPELEEFVSEARRRERFTRVSQPPS